MFLKSVIAVSAALLAFAGMACAAPLEAYGNLPTLTDLTLSPDGTSIAYVRAAGAKRLIVMQKLGAKEFLGLIDITDAKLRALQWADNRRLIITTSTTALPRGLIGRRHEWYMAQSFDTETKSQRTLLDHVRGVGERSNGVMNVIAGVPQPRIIDGHTVLFVRGIYFPHEEGRPALFRLDLTDNVTRMASREGETHAEDWVVDEAGNIVAEEDYYEGEQRWKLKLFRDGENVQAVDVPAEIEGPEVEGLNEDGTSVVIQLPQSGEGSVYQQISLKDGRVSSWQPPKPGFGNLMGGVRTGKVIGGLRVTDRNDFLFFDPHADKVWLSLKAAFKDATDVDIVSWSDDYNKLVLHVFGGPYGDGYFFVDMTTHKADPIGPAYDGISEVAPVKWIDYKAGDGRVIHAYLTLPLNREAKNLPLIVLPHGGPHSRDDPGFDWFAQALASRGYVVLQPQFRGSAGFGMELLAAGFGEFGRKMQTDLSDGVRALAAQSLIDPRRVCIVGASYGGYAALAGAAFDTGVYRCAVSIAGLSDLKAQLRYWHWPRSSLDDRGERFWDRFLGVNDAGDPKLDEISPIKHIDRISIPILLIHGRDDTVVPFFQSDDMADELKSAKKPFQLVELDGEDHWLSKSKTRLEMLTATVKFLETNNPPN